jgi:lysophospholipase L1-like esterase
VRPPLAVAVLFVALLAVLTALVGTPRTITGPGSARAAVELGSARAGDCGPGWGTGWLAAVQAAPLDPAYRGATLRLIVHPQLTGSQVRIRLSNAHGDAPLAIGAASVARAGSAAAVVADTLRPVTFDGRPGAVLAPGRDLVSDPVPVLAEAGRALAVSLHLSAVPRVGSVHPVALQTSFLSRPGDFTRTAGAAPFGRRVTSWPLLTGLDVLLPRPTNVLVAIGDSITDGYGTRVDTDQRWTDALFRRLGEAGEPERMAVLNAGLSANQLLADAPRHGGESPITRFGRDVAAVSGVTDVILHIGTNDIAAGRSADEITGGVRWFAERARAAGLRVLLTTITPARGGVHGSRTAVATRNAVNAWIREHGREHADGVVDFAAAVADGSAPSRPAPAYDSGDGLHLSAAGYRALAAAVPLDTLTGSPCRTADPAGTRLLVSGR